MPSYNDYQKNVNIGKQKAQQLGLSSKVFIVWANGLHLRGIGSTTVINGTKYRVIKKYEGKHFEWFFGRNKTSPKWILQKDSAKTIFDFPHFKVKTKK